MKPEEITNLAILDIPMSEKMEIMMKKNTTKTGNQTTRDENTTETEGDDDMASKTKTAKGTKAANKKAAKAKAERAAKKPAADAKQKHVSALDAAAEVLKKAGKPMRSQEMIAAMTEAGLWSSPNGKTPHATLYSAILREIGTKGGESRFKKSDRGLFEYAK